MGRRRSLGFPRSSARGRLKKKPLQKESLLSGPKAWDSGRESVAGMFLKPLRAHMYEKTMAVVFVVILLGVFNLTNLPWANRIIETVHFLTLHHISPGEMLEAAQPAIRAVQNFVQPGSAPQTPEPPGLPDGEETMAVPVNGVLITPYGLKASEEDGRLEMHYGIDVAAEAGSPVYAAFSGVVTLIKEHPVYGTTVYLEHSDSRVTIYGRVDQVKVEEGDWVNRGQELAAVAQSSGQSYLHFEVWLDRQPVDPGEFLTIAQ